MVVVVVVVVVMGRRHAEAGMLKRALACPFPLPAPPKVSSELLHSDRAVEAALDGKVALAEALARQWFGVILQPRCAGRCVRAGCAAALA